MRRPVKMKGTNSIALITNQKHPFNRFNLYSGSWCPYGMVPFSISFPLIPNLTKKSDNY